jgi:hypothetical protein
MVSILQVVVIKVRKILPAVTFVEDFGSFFPGPG